MEMTIGPGLDFEGEIMGKTVEDLDEYITKLNKEIGDLGKRLDGGDISDSEQAFDLLKEKIQLKLWLSELRRKKIEDNQ